MTVSIIGGGGGSTRKNHWSAADNSHTLSYDVGLSIPRQELDSKSYIRDVTIRRNWIVIIINNTINNDNNI